LKTPASRRATLLRRVRRGERIVMMSCALTGGDPTRVAVEGREFTGIFS